MEKSITREGCTIVYDIYNEDAADTVVLLHGYGVDSRMWAPQLPALSAYRVINIDVRGHGRSRPAAEFSIALAADDLHEILIAENALRCSIVALSMGGYITQEYAWRYGGAERYMITGATPVFLDCFSGLELWALRYSAGIFNLYRWPSLCKTMTRFCCCTEGGREAVAPLFDAMTKKEFVTSWRAIAHCLHREEMYFDAPLLVLCGEHDRTGTVKKCMKSWYWGYRTEPFFFRNAAHVANLDAPEAFNRVMLKFLISDDVPRDVRRSSWAQDVIRAF